MFEKKSLKEKPSSSGKQSILSVRLEQCPLQLNNPFNEYSKFDGKVSENETEVKSQLSGIGDGVIIIIRFKVLEVIQSNYRMSFIFSKTEDIKRSEFGLKVISTVVCLGGLKQK